MPVRIGIIGKTNTGKTTFFNAATMLSGRIDKFPFTTKTPQRGIGYAKTLCVCRELGVKDNPKNSVCINGWRFIPIEIVDLPGLVKDAWKGKGLGNEFLSVAAQTDALIHMVDASGSVDADGNIAEPGTGDPVQDFYDIERELVMWIAKIIESKRKYVEKTIETRRDTLKGALASVLTGLKVKEEHVAQAIEASNTKSKAFHDWTEDDLLKFSEVLRRIAKPSVIVANKMDIPMAEKNYSRMVEALSPIPVIPASAEAELILRKAEKSGLISYVPGEEVFQVADQSKLTEKQKWALNYIQERVLNKWWWTGVQFAINVLVFKVLRMNVVYPVEDERRLSDKHGNVLPDVFLMSYDATALDLANEIHTELGKTMICAIDARTGLRLPKDYKLRDRDIIKIVATSHRG
ncbi:redox-regulated ATPase YchF [Candidatus Bathyarchaeota archaeon]|nr:redox-regulated ATPase YchF [Candidatus Bathyarchaeota archaeon]MBS7613157.1 redox-regulated ATPase YchF [Candidatus Bathyarchaeota archaeon]MBS7617139.1 redox-regulated ATPase YchF [Candidatus Bathyarchaeota archaeon]